MSGECCPLPSQSPRDEASAIVRMLSARTIAVVGASDDPRKPSNYVSAYMQSHGYRIIPVNPNHETVLGEKCYASLEKIPEKVDLVNVFRRPRACDDVARQAVRIGAKGVWLQSGITNEHARCITAAAAIDFVQNRCIMMEHMHRRRK